MKISRLVAREIYDSLGWPTIGCDLYLDNGMYVTASVPSGTSKSKFEAIELRDGGTRLGGQGVLKAIENIEHVIAPAVLGQEPDVIAMDLRLLELDGTDNKSILGANATLAVSMAVARAQALINDIDLYELIAHICEIESVSLPFPMFNLIEGGVHADNGLAIQEFMIMPVGAQSFREAMECAVAVYHMLGKVLQKRGKLIAVGAEGGYSSEFEDEHEALDLLMEAIEKAETEDETEGVLALDIAASQFYNPKTKKYMWKGKNISSQNLIEIYAQLAEKYPLYSIEDGMAETDYDGWITMMDAFGQDLQIVGDDLFATHPVRIMEGVTHGYANAAIIKPNQIGTVTETLQAIKLCKTHEINTIVSHRSGETDDTFIVDLALGSCSGQIKAGGVTRGERLAKYNHMLSIEDILMRSMLGI
ncbi:MAG TPA: phosphopyruvate hydratase [Candidatus Babeliales bacterium]|nr:phosphopyruvate hydratase [Candidatus Babeliales bacterium]